MRLDPVRFKSTEHVNNDWTLTVESNVSLEDVLTPEFLANVAAQLRPYDHVRVRTDTGEWYAELLVMSAGRTWAKLRPLYKLDLAATETEVSPEAQEGYEILHRGPHLKFCVVRKSDKQPLKEQFDTKKEARDWLMDFART